MSKWREVAHESMPRSFFITKQWSSMCGEVPAPDARRSSVGPPASVLDEIRRQSQGHREVQEVEEKLVRHVLRELERQDEEDRKRRKVEQEKTESARTGDARRSEPMEETREKRPAEEEVERDNKRSRPTNDETSAWKWMVGTAGRSMKTNCTSRAWNPTRMKTSAMRTVGDPAFEEGVSRRPNRGAACEGEVERGQVHGEDPALRWTSRSASRRPGGHRSAPDWWT